MIDAAGPHHGPSRGGATQSARSHCSHQERVVRGAGRGDVHVRAAAGRHVVTPRAALSTAVTFMNVFMFTIALCAEVFTNRPV